MRQFFRRFLILFTVGVTLICTLCGIWGVRAQSDLSSKVIRIHVIANSDSDADQALKMKVRDRVLDLCETLVSDCTDRDSARRILDERASEINSVAREAIAEAGYSHSVSSSLSCEFYPTREYDDLRLPAGDYLSLRITIGSGEGKNFWCVLFPPICRSSARADEELCEVGFTKSEIRLLTEDEDVHYVIKFKIVEVASSIKERLGSMFRKRGGKR